MGELADLMEFGKLAAWAARREAEGAGAPLCRTPYPRGGHHCHCPLDEYLLDGGLRLPAATCIDVKATRDDGRGERVVTPRWANRIMTAVDHLHVERVDDDGERRLVFVPWDRITAGQFAAIVREVGAELDAR